MKRKERKNKAISKAEQKNIILPSDTRKLASIRKVIQTMWTKHGLPAKTGYLISLAVDEALSSIMHHAQDMKQPGNISIELMLNDICFKAIIQDNTNSLDFSGLSYKDKNNVLEKAKQHQLGIFLISNIMDEIIYHYHKGFQNELQLTRFITR